MQELISGQTAPKTGEYKVIGAGGRTVGTIYVNKGDTMPPTQNDGDYFVFSI